MPLLLVTPAPAPRERASRVCDEVLARLARTSSGSLTTQLFKKGYRQPVLAGLRPLNKHVRSFAGRAYTMRFIPAREDIDAHNISNTSPNWPPAR